MKMIIDDVHISLVRIIVLILYPHFKLRKEFVLNFYLIFNFITYLLQTHLIIIYSFINLTLIYIFLYIYILYII